MVLHPPHPAASDLSECVDADHQIGIVLQSHGGSPYFQRKATTPGSSMLLPAQLSGCSPLSGVELEWRGEEEQCMTNVSVHTHNDCEAVKQSSWITCCDQECTKLSSGLTTFNSEPKKQVETMQRSTVCLFSKLHLLTTGLVNTCTWRFFLQSHTQMKPHTYVGTRQTTVQIELLRFPIMTHTWTINESHLLKK